MWIKRQAFMDFESRKTIWHDFLKNYPLPLEKKEICLLLDALAYAYKRYDHQAVFTVEESLSITGHFPGGHTKNLFLRDRKKNYWLVTALESTQIDLKSLSKILSAKGNLSFVREEILWEKLAVKAGSVTPLALINNMDKEIQFVVDRKILGKDLVNVHPLRNDATVGLIPDDFMEFVALCGLESLQIDFETGVIV